MFSRIMLWVVSFAGVNVLIYLFVADKLVNDVVCHLYNRLRQATLESPATRGIIILVLVRRSVVM